MAGFDGLKTQRAYQSFLFLGDGDPIRNVAPESLLVLNRDDQKIFDMFDSAGLPMTDFNIAKFCSQKSVYGLDMDVIKMRHESGFLFRLRKVANGNADVARSEQVLPLELDEDDDGFLAAEVLMNLKRKMI
ncbi:Ankyrin repeat domain-containing protein [Trema orientale]|uniref:Ankyrin repeat domain-containing protein n=1 Tax=Trema orientale TaxID=63057 RepID=A0A2P5FCA5_TREOI|nr:Ankyrin repeat domain-containing protein [Trema orientale]